ncbi:hypothetical protein QBC46DRAFT_379775 [Diplogelasinospora grovesii]|uniref:Secreted protein n=1 Tax=Diplogelasinospora grovesii TaxID=303347 RepID=A0AAN6NF23_9PEZI|nr:hypothetical protein QBC46DRAFT_379775 [Diplogelasinospora grovesii]
MTLPLVFLAILLRETDGRLFPLSLDLRGYPGATKRFSSRVPTISSPSFPLPPADSANPLASAGLRVWILTCQLDRQDFHNCDAA